MTRFLRRIRERFTKILQATVWQVIFGKFLKYYEPEFIRNTPAESMLFFVCIVRNTLTGLNQSLLRNTSLVLQIKSFPRIHGIRVEDDSNHIPNRQKLPWHRVDIR